MLLVFFIVLTIVVGVVSVVYNYGIKTINVDCVGIDINVFGEVDESEILIINSCYDYLKKYYKSSLPDDTKELEQIYNNLNIVFSNDLYFKGFSKSKFQEYLESDNDYSKNGGIYEEEYMKLKYYTRLISVKLKTQLLLGEYQKFTEDYKNNFALFLFLNINFPEVILQDSNFEENPALISRVLDAYDLMVECTDDPTELALIYQSALRLNTTKSDDIRVEKYSNSCFEYMEYLPEFLMDYKFENLDLNPYKLMLVRQGTVLCLTQKPNNF